MIVNYSREPKYSLYYIGFHILNFLKDINGQTIEELHFRLNNEMNVKLGIDFLYLSLDWLYLIGAITLKDNQVILCI